MFFLLGVNLYHLYYVAIPKTYALASLFIAMGFDCVCHARRGGWRGAAAAAAGGLSLALAAGTRISLGILLAVVGFGLLFAFRRFRWTFLWFGLGGALGLAVVYGFFLADPVARAGLVAAQTYHAARGGFDPVFTVGSVSRLVRWYLPLFIVLGLGVAGLAGARRADGGRTTDDDGRSFFAWLALAGFLAVFAVQILAPFPYEDYQVPVMGLLAVFAAVSFVGHGGPGDARLATGDGRQATVDSRQPGDARQATGDNPNTQTPNNPNNRLLLVLGLAWVSAFGSPLLEKWTTNGQDRFWTLKKEKCELAQLRDVAREIESLDPGGDTLLTQDLYLAIETGRKVPEGLEMGPFSMLSDEKWRELLSSAPCPVAALSGYSFAIDPPRCDEVPIERQMEYWSLLKKNYDLEMKEDSFGQNATTLMILKRKSTEGK